MDLTFNKVDDLYVVEFKVDADFNLHIERDKSGSIKFYQRTSDAGNYKLIDKQGNNTENKTIDVDFVGSVYPKYIKVESFIEPTLAIVTTSGTAEII